MERGANTFPFHNLLPYSESNEGLFLFFSPSLNWIKEKSVATLAIRTFAIQKSQSQFTVLHWGDSLTPCLPLAHLVRHAILQLLSCVLMLFQPHSNSNLYVSIHQKKHLKSWYYII